MPKHELTTFPETGTVIRFSDFDDENTYEFYPEEVVSVLKKIAQRREITNLNDSFEDMGEVILQLAPNEQPISKYKDFILLCRDMSEMFIFCIKGETATQNHTTFPQTGNVIRFTDNDDENTYEFYPEEVVSILKKINKRRHITNLCDSFEDMGELILQLAPNDHPILEYKDYIMLCREMYEMFSCCIKGEEEE
jgi:hypothetical protein